MRRLRWNSRPALLASLLLGLAPACTDKGSSAQDCPEAEAAPAAAPLVDAELLGEAVEGSGGRAQVDGLLLRLAFDPLIHGSGPVELQKVQGQGYRLLGVVEGSPLWQLGLREGDVLTQVDGEAILGGEDQLRDKWERRPTQVTLTYRRGEEARELWLRVRPGVAWRGAAPDPGPPPMPRLGGPAPVGEGAKVLRLADGLRCLPGADGAVARCEITRALVDELLANPEALARQARVVPALREGEARGFKLYSMRPPSLGILVGLKNGDLITGVNGRELTDIDSALATYEALRDETRFTVDLVRRGEETTLSVTIVEQLSGAPANLAERD